MMCGVCCACCADAWRDWLPSCRNLTHNYDISVQVIFQGFFSWVCTFCFKLQFVFFLYSKVCLDARIHFRHFQASNPFLFVNHRSHIADCFVLRLRLVSFRFRARVEDLVFRLLPWQLHSYVPAWAATEPFCVLVRIRTAFTECGEVFWSLTFLIKGNRKHLCIYSVRRSTVLVVFSSETRFVN